MKYYYIRVQRNQGCDYTIGCGLDIQEIHASSSEEAIEKIIDLPSTWKQDLERLAEEDESCICDSDFLVDSGLRDVMPNIDCYGSSRIKEAFILEVNNEINVFSILEKKYKEVKEFQEELMKNAKEKAEKKQYEILKKKYEKY